MACLRGERCLRFLGPGGAGPTTFISNERTAEGLLTVREIIFSSACPEMSYCMLLTYSDIMSAFQE